MEYIEYTEYIKPAFAPPAWVFGPVWTVLYIGIAIGFGYIFYKWGKGELNSSIATPFILNLFFNFAFTPIQFEYGSLLLGSIDILLVLGTLIWGMVVIWKKYKWVALSQIPYLLWVSFATVLQFSILILNS